MSLQDEQNTKTTIYGFADAATAFDQRHPEWTAVMTRLDEAIKLAFTQADGLTDVVDKFIYFYGRVIVEDFWELFLMAANGYGFGAMKLLRSMYEHTVTLKYLHDNPNELQAFLDFDHVQQHKLMVRIRDTFGADALPSETVAKVEERYQEVKERFMMKSCKSEACTEKRPSVSWNSKLDFVSMTKKAGALGSFIVPGYYEPLRHAHSTFRAMTDRLEIGDTEMSFRYESQPREADQALMIAHSCLLNVIEIQKERFGATGLENAWQGSLQDWVLVWSPGSLG